jgi:hypothetical protein
MHALYVLCHCMLCYVMLCYIVMILYILFSYFIILLYYYYYYYYVILLFLYYDILHYVILILYSAALCHDRDTHRPVVKFQGGLERTIGSDTFSMSLGGRLLAQRMQIPLDLAWSISVHRSQGMVSDLCR